MLLLKQKGFEVESSGTRVAADEAATIARAEEIIAAAEAEAKRIGEEARAAFEAEKQRGYAAGLAEGKAQILSQKLDLLDESVRYMESIEQKVSDIVMKALKKCVAEIGDKELVVQIVKKSMQALIRNQRQVSVKVAPDMVSVVRERVKEIMVDYPSLAYIDVDPDESLAPTACIVETEAGLVEASIDGQLKAIEASIKKNFSKDA